MILAHFLTVAATGVGGKDALILGRDRRWCRARGVWLLVHFQAVVVGPGASGLVLPCWFPRFCSAGEGASSVASRWASHAGPIILRKGFQFGTMAMS